MLYRCMLAFLLLVLPAAAQTISTFAGGGNGDGNAAVQAWIDLPYNVAADGKGNLFISDETGHVIRKVDSRGIITTLAGSGVPGFADGPATQAQFNLPSGIRLDSAGNLYVADTGNHRIRKVDPSGNVTTVAGSGTAGDSGDRGPATAARLNTPFGVAVDASGYVYIADTFNSRVKRVDTAGIITTIAGTGSPGSGGDGWQATLAPLNGPLGLALDAAGNLYIADSGNMRVRKVDASGKMSTVAGTGSAGSSGDGGPATQAKMAGPQDVAMGPDGALYILDAYSNVAVVRSVNPQGIISTVAGVPGYIGLFGDTGLAKNAVFFSPSGVTATTDGKLYISDSGNHRVRVVQNGIITTFAGGVVMDNGPATQAALSSPTGLRFDAFGNLYIADSNNHRIRKVDRTGSVVTIAGGGLPGYSGDGGAAMIAQLLYPQAIAFDSDNNLYIADSGNHRIRKVTPTGTMTTVAGTGASGYASSDDGGPATKARLSSPYGVAVDSSGNLYIADRGNRRIRKVDAATQVISTVAGNGALTLCGSSISCGDNGPATSASLADPRDVVADSQGNLYIADASLADASGRLVGGFLVRKVDGSGNITRVAGNGQSDATGDNNPPTAAGIGVPSAIALDGAGNLFIADERNHRVRKAAAGGFISTLAGSTNGFSGDGGPAVSALLSRPRGLAIDATGNLYVADSGNSRIRRITGVGAVSPRRRMSIVAGNQQSGAVGSPLPQQLTVAVFDGLTPVEGVTVQFTVSPAGAADLNPAQVNTDSTGKASTAVMLKGSAGQLTVTASSSQTDPVTFTLTASPVTPANALVNGATFSAGAGVAPGTIVSLFGQGLAKGIAPALALPLPTKLLDTEVRVQSGSTTVSAPLYYVSPGQINFQMPFEISDPVINIVVRSSGASSQSISVNVVEASPGVFTTTQDGKGSAVLLHADYRAVIPSNPAYAGETVLIYCTGLGAVTPAQASGTAAPSDPPAMTKIMPQVSIGGVPAIVDFAGLAPYFAGLYQINVQIPASVPSGPAIPLAITVNSRPANSVTIPVL